MTQNYDYRARDEFAKQISNVEKQSLTDRQEARVNWVEAMKNPSLVADRVSWLIDGSYGYGSYIMAREVVQNKRMNRVAWLAITIAALEWNCPSDFARGAWNRLSKDEQNAVNQVIKDVLDDAYQAIKSETAEASK